MNRWILLLIFYLSLFETLAQSGYYYQTEFISLTKNGSSLRFIQANSEASKLLLNDMHGNKSLKSDTRVIDKISTNGFMVDISSLNNINLKNCYLSHIYESSSGGTTVVLPKVVIMLKDQTEINSVIKTCESNILSVYSQRGKRFVLECSTNNSDQVLTIVDKIRKHSDVLWCEPEMIYDYEVNNPLYQYQYYLKNIGQLGGVSGIDINVETAWNITNGKKEIKVAIVDQGVDFDHEDLSGNIINGYTISDANGFGVPKNETTLYPKAHGVACAGIVGAKNNSIGIRGIASEVSIVPVNIAPYAGSTYNKSGMASTIEIADALYWAWNNADILNCSWGGQGKSNDIANEIENAIRYGRNGKGCIIVCASGNSYPTYSDVSFPANLDGVITVGAIDCNGLIQNYSQRGNSMDLVAPSGGIPGNIYTTDRMGAQGYGDENYTKTFNGTSAACPQVSGVVALMLFVRPELKESQIRQILQNTAKDLGASGFDNIYGYGLIDANAAVKAAMFYGLTLIGPTQVCTEATFTLNNLPAGATVHWNVGGGRWNALELVSGQGTTQAAYRATGSGRGNVQVTVSLNGASTTLSQTVWAGAPSAELDVSSDGVARASACLRTDPLTMHAEPPVWQLWNPSQRVNFVEDEDGRCGRVRGAAGDWNIRGTVTLRNGCGEATGRFSMSGTSQTDPCPRLIEQRGSGSNLAVMYTKPIDCPVWPIRGLEQPTSVPVIEVYDRMGRLVLRQRGEQAHLGGLRPGLYIVRAHSGGEVATLTVIRE